MGKRTGIQILILHYIILHILCELHPYDMVGADLMCVNISDLEHVHKCSHFKSKFQDSIHMSMPTVFSRVVYVDKIYDTVLL